jgi:hypothetical protein
MRSRFRDVVLSCLMAAAAAGCGTSATGITAAIQPDPVSAISAGMPGVATYSASWDVVVSDLTGQGGVVESIEARVGGAAVNIDATQSPTFGATSSQATLGAFDRRTFRQAGSFTVDPSGGATLTVTAHFRAQDGAVHQATAQARVTVR